MKGNKQNIKKCYLRCKKFKTKTKKTEFHKYSQEETRLISNVNFRPYKVEEKIQMKSLRKYCRLLILNF